MKKRIAAVMVAMAMLVVSGCGSGSAPQESSTPAASPEETKTIAISQFAEFSGLDDCREGFMKGLKEEGFEEGKNLKVDYQNAQGDIGIVNQIANQFGASNPDLACGITTPSSQALYNVCETKNIPVVYIAVSDPVAAGFANEDGTSVKGITGTSDDLPLEPQVKMIRELMPEATKMGVVYCTSEVNSIGQAEKLKEICPKYGFELVVATISTVQDTPAAVDHLLAQVDVINNLSDNTVTTSLPMIIDKAAAKGVPVFGSDGKQVETGCAASMAIDYVSLGAQSGRMAGRILKGETIEDIPYERVSSFNLVYNKDMLERLGIDPPSDPDAQAVAHTGKH